MNIPEPLRPTSLFRVDLKSGRHVMLPRCSPKFVPWAGEQQFDWGGKPVLDHRGQPYFAELIILEMLREAGWQGVCVSAFGGRYYYDVMPTNWGGRAGISLPDPQQALLSSIRTKAVTSGGCFDVFA